MRGRKPKPAAVRKAEGNPGKRAIPEPIPIRPGLPECPEHLNDVARAEWNRIIVELDIAGLMTVLDRPALAAYCTAWSRWIQAEKLLAKKSPVIKTKNGNLIQNPALSICNQAMEQMRRLLVEFGLTPSSRSRVTSNKPPEKKDELSDLDAFPNDVGSSVPTPGPAHNTPAPAPARVTRKKSIKKSGKPKRK